jgi:putative NADH-flavin reductase
LCCEQLLTDENGNSEISAEDHQTPSPDLLENGGHARERVAVAS